MEVLDHGQGPDLRDRDGRLWEHKGSVVRKTGGYHCSINLTFPKACGIEDRTNTAALDNCLQQLRSNIRKRTEGGGLICELRGFRNSRSKENRISSRSLQEFVEEALRRGKLAKLQYNLGCKMCSKCNEWHRIKRLQTTSQFRDLGGGLTADNMDKLFEDCPTECKLEDEQNTYDPCSSQLEQLKASRQTVGNRQPGSSATGPLNARLEGVNKQKAVASLPATSSATSKGKETKGRKKGSRNDVTAEGLGEAGDGQDGVTKTEGKNGGKGKGIMKREIGQDSVNKIAGK